jgi:hypothetical protein
MKEDLCRAYEIFAKEHKLAIESIFQHIFEKNEEFYRKGPSLTFERWFSLSNGSLSGINQSLF